MLTENDALFEQQLDVVRNSAPFVFVGEKPRWRNVDGDIVREARSFLFGQAFLSPSWIISGSKLASPNAYLESPFYLYLRRTRL